MKPWEAERVVGPDAARALARRHIPADTVVPLGAGWDNTAYLIDDEWVFRFPRRTIAVPLLEREIAVLPALADRLPVPIPRPEHAGVDADGWPYAGYRRLAGEVLASSELEPDAALGAALGHCVRVLQAQDPIGMGGLGPDTIGKVDVAARLPRTRELARALGVVVPEELVARALAASRAGPRQLAVVHGDLDGRHVLVAGGAVAGIIDWGDVHHGDPATDLALGFSALDGPARAAFFAAYGDVPGGEDTLHLARFRALNVALSVVAWAEDIGDVAAARGGRRALARATGA